MGRPIGKTMPLPTSVMSYGKNKLRPEFWFSVPKNRTDELYRFINTWVPHLYGELDETQIAARGFELIQHDTEWVKGAITKVKCCIPSHNSGGINQFCAFAGWPNEQRWRGHHRADARIVGGKCRATNRRFVLHFSCPSPMPTNRAYRITLSARRLSQFETNGDVLTN